MREPGLAAFNAAAGLVFLLWVWWSGDFVGTWEAVLCGALAANFAKDAISLWRGEPA